MEQGARASGIRATRLVEALEWAAALAPSPLRLATSCCGMAMVQGGDFFETLGSAPPAASSRAADLLIVAGSLTRRQLPALLDLYARMCEPRWVVAWGTCAISGGPYDNYATISGLSRILPVDCVVPGCPPAAAALRDALECLRSGAARARRAASSGATDRPIEGFMSSGGDASPDSETTRPGFA
ncbi:MAG: NADH-quinone oxidoreductase subunit NuoB [Myxococcota bacterium]